jgi:(E)-4-hydroxy-3-methylbut-2-enyl-diphosphate synthase
LSPEIRRRKTKSIDLGGVRIGGAAPIVVQSMTSCDTRDVEATVAQIDELEQAGCEIVRVAVPDEAASLAIREIRSRIHIPLIADIHFQYPLALLAMNHGADGIRINPGNIPADGIRRIVGMAKANRKVIRIGINAGSLEKEIAASHGGPTAGALVESALKNIRLLEEMNFDLIKLSLKSSDVATTIEAYREVSAKTDYPLHLGVTEAGTLIQSAIKSAIGIGTLLYEGIGDTIRVSVTGSPVPEIALAYGILRALNIRQIGPDIVSCPTCGRGEIDIAGLSGTDVPERKEADVGIAGGRGVGILFKKGEVVRKIREREFVPVLLEEVRKMAAEAAKSEGLGEKRHPVGPYHLKA